MKLVVSWVTLMALTRDYVAARSELKKSLTPESVARYKKAKAEYLDYVEMVKIADKMIIPTPSS